MSATLDIKPETAEKLGVIARSLNVSVDDLLRTYVPGFVSEPKTNGVADVVRAFDDWEEAFGSDAPPLSDEAISRSTIYGSR
jgi:hypothetical protein